jgi:F0F1-type ATP synthase membrane subunit c/vacuolar-type H+-ATPase subunit K
MEGAKTSVEDQGLARSPEARGIWQRMKEDPRLKRIALAAGILAGGAALDAAVSSRAAAEEFSKSDSAEAVAKTPESKEAAREKEFAVVLDTLQAKWGQSPNRELGDKLIQEYVYADSAGTILKEKDDSYFGKAGDIRRPSIAPEFALWPLLRALKQYPPGDVMRILSILMFGETGKEDSVLASFKKAIDDPAEAMNLYDLDGDFATALMQGASQQGEMYSLMKSSSPFRLVREADLKARQEGQKAPEIKK